jgi:hypothetical protein
LLRVSKRYLANESLEEFEQGQGIPLNQAFAEFQEKYDLPVGLTHCNEISLLWASVMRLKGLFSR